jgi:TRAP-type C4-dicarboxylate transport system permease small subunit
MIRRIDRLTAHCESALSIISALLLFVVMAIVVTDVFMRYVFNRPFSWSYDLISLYLMAALFYFSLSRTFAINGHIGVDILQTRMSVKLRLLCQVVIGIATCVLFAVIAWVCAARAWDDWTQDSVAAGAIPWPSWLSDILVPIGAGLLSFRGLVHALAHGTTLAGGPEIIPLPPLAGTLEKVGFE